MPELIDYTTGEIVEDDAFADIDSAEAELYQALGDEVDQKLRQTRILMLIRDRELFRQKIDLEGRYYTSFQVYLKDMARQLDAIGIGKYRSLSNWISKYRIFVSQLGKPETVLRTLGAHGELLLPAASRMDATGELLDEDTPTPNGTRLGRKKFSQLVDFIEEKVVASKSDVPEEHWGTDDTKEVVSEWMQRTTEDKPKLSLDAVWVGADKVKVKRMTLWIGDFMYELPSDLMPITHFRQWAKGMKVEGLGEEWRS